MPFRHESLDSSELEALIQSPTTDDELGSRNSFWLVAIQDEADDGYETESSIWEGDLSDFRDAWPPTTESGTFNRSMDRLNIARFGIIHNRGTVLTGPITNPSEDIPGAIRLRETFRLPNTFRVSDLSPIISDLRTLTGLRVPDFLRFYVDDSGSMNAEDVETALSELIAGDLQGATWANVIADKATFTSERWVERLTFGIGQFKET